MNLNRYLVPLFAATGLLALAACGGGGGGPGPVASADEAMQDIIAETPAVSVDAVQNANPASTISTGVEAASSLPAFGSVTQSANRSGVSGVSTDRASTEFDGDNFAVRIDRRSGSHLYLSTQEDGTFLNPETTSELAGHDKSQDGFIIEYTPRETTLLHGFVSWDSSDPTDYLAGGYWLHASGDVLGAFDIDEAGAFADGPEISMSNRPTMPVQGTASYRGGAVGLYGGESATTEEIGIFQGDMALTADFAASTIGGCVGCNGGIYLTGSGASQYTVRLGATPFESNGVFRGTSVTVEHPDLEFVSNSGAWGGMFSNVPDADGDPRLVAGTLGGQAATADSSKAVFVGAYYATSQ